MLKGIPIHSQVWMSHGDTISNLPSDFHVIASTKDVRIAAYTIKKEETYAIQFHPEVYHSLDGKKILHNFLIDIAGCSQDWTPSSFVKETLLERSDNFRIFSCKNCGGVASVNRTNKIYYCKNESRPNEYTVSIHIKKI